MAATITALPTPPSRQSPTTFSERTDAFLGALPTFQSEANTLAAEVETNAGTASTAASTATTKAAEASDSAVTAAQQAAIAVGAAASLPDGTISDVEYGPSWGGDATSAPSKNTVRDKIESMVATMVTQGKHTIWIPAGAMTPATTNGAAAGSTEMTTNKNMVKSLDFDTATQEFAQFDIGMPKSWDEGTVTFEVCWTAASGSGGVVFALQAVATSNDDTMDVTFGTEQTVTDTFIAANDCHWSSESAAITIGGTPAALDRVNFRIKRNVSDASDTLAVDAKLLGIRLYYTTNAATDV